MKNNCNTFVFDFDSTLITKESLDEIICLSLQNSLEKNSIIKDIEKITNKGMSGEIDLIESISLRLNKAKIHKDNFELFAKNVIIYITPGLADIIRYLYDKKQQIFIVSGGFLEGIYPLADYLKIPRKNCFANTCFFDSDGYVTGIDVDNLACASNGKGKIINNLKKQKQTIGKIILIGDGANDLQAYKEKCVDIFCGFGINVERNNVKKEAPYFCTTIKEFSQFCKNIIN